MSLFGSDDPRPVHFVGVAGAGMTALAELFVRRGVSVTGCDAHADGAADVRALGVRVLQGHDPSHVANARAVVYTSAIESGHPELAHARALGIPVMRRAEALAESVRDGRLIAVAGTHGKSTTTVMVAEALASAGMNPTALVGARIPSWNGNLRRGGMDVFVAEADEYDRSFLTLDPETAIITNVEADHLDIYRDLDDIRDAFAEFAERARYVVLCADDAGANSLPLPPSAEILRYGVTSPDARLVARDIRADMEGVSFGVVFDGDDIGRVRIPLPGTHNVRNALAAVGSGLLWGATLEQLASGLEQMTGAERRFQRLGDGGGVTVIDDYAHHPTEIRATLTAARARYPERRLVAVFQPHLFTRTRDLATEFGSALAEADVIVLLEIYAAREDPIEGVTAGLVADAVGRAGGRVSWRGERDDAAGAIVNLIRPGDVVLTLGAGDITKTGPEVLQRLGPKGQRADGPEGTA
ncbi:MAG TPA: UDP-N-acetylmuramate--L-alanine ligase [Gemmatimonadaceae bacterium]|nr:UDP-N-acetylmuramate--L-alanine ligase [Gemmatimonadaceae bacterium]